MRVFLGRWQRAVLAVATASMTALASAPPGVSEPLPGAAFVAPPDGPARASLVADLDSGRIYGARDPYGTYAPASTIKPLLAMVVMDLVNPGAAMRATAADNDVECSCVGLAPGAVYTARQLLDALLMVSGNDAANALADMVGGYRVAIQRMNVKAYQLGARSTKASSPSGLDGPGWETVTTPHDLAVIYRAALNYPLFAQIIHQSTAAFPDGKGGVKQIASHDRLLASYPGFIGGKTGFTNLAKETYVALAQRSGRRLIAVMMYSDDPLWDQGRSLLDWGFAQQ
ncbi:D-alanyl-D-alanine carboxypeptidase [Mycolicibacterium anyangense]|uniref:D-alanyl-D-alanine carboxypeptidase n=1 Tax=Mycolicibacterium anyangense TaxID=1431246 RepID=A0A6N4W4V4_9MYCO|nr:serine hydrolase [Mycolicibacterium anyangense]BBZ75104.1 D-alanyl-D-alanine carboxypeptidase [Mycolicibacterium anyangense]